MRKLDFNRKEKELKRNIGNKGGNLLEALDGFADAATNFGQLLGSENEGSHSRNYHQFGYAQSKQGVANQTTLVVVSSSVAASYPLLTWTNPRSGTQG